MASPVKKIYVDSQYRTADSLDTSSFKIELPHSISMPRDSIFMKDDVCIPHAWQTFETDFNDKMYFYLIYTPLINKIFLQNLTHFLKTFFGQEM